jgi:PAS domain S-box-containing protein
MPDTPQLSAAAAASAGNVGLADPDFSRQLADCRLRLALEVGGMLSWEWLIDSAEVAFSQDYGEYYGLAATGAVIPNDDSLLPPVHPDDRAPLLAAFRLSLANDREFQFEFRGPPRSGQPTWYRTRSRIIRDQFGRPERVIGVTQDITDLRRAEELRRLSEAEVARLVEERTADLSARIVQLTVLHRIGEICFRATDADDLLAGATRALSEALSENNCGFVMFDETRTCLQAHPSFLLANPQADRSAVPAERGIIGQVARTGRLRRIGNVRREPDYWAADPSTQSELCVPVWSNGRVAGVINVERRSVDAFSNIDEQLVRTVSTIVGNCLEKLQARGPGKGELGSCGSDGQ